MVFAGLFVLSSVVGCGSQSADNSGKDGGAAGSEHAGLKVYSSAALPALADPLPPLDGGRVDNLAPPKGWEPLSRDNAYLARFIVKGHNANDLPRLLVTAEDAGAELPTNVSADNVDDFAEKIQAELSKFREPAKALQLGDNFYARYVTTAKKGNRGVDRQVLVTVQNGRRYTYTLEVYSDQIMTYRDQAYATSAGVKYLSAGTSPSSSPVDSPAEPTDPATDPASEPPSE
jgi:hypothetical protein